MINKLIILGGHIQALGLARQAKPKGVRVELVIPDSYSVARFSHFVDDVHICKNEEDLVCCLEKNGNESTMLFPTSDEYIDFIVRQYEWLKEIFNIALPDLEIVKLFADKTKTYRFAEENDIRHPWSRYPQNMEDVEQMADDLEYSVVIKPAIMYDFHKKFGKKAFLCEDKGALLSKVKVLVDAGYPVNSLIFQEFLSGGAKNLFSFGFFAVEGEVQSSITVNRIRQNPMDFGNSTTFAVSVDVPEIDDIAKRIIKNTNYTGMGEVEFMFDKGVYKFLEINTRAWKWHVISNGRDFSFIGDWLDWLNNKSLVERKSTDIPCAWVERLTDFAVVLKGVFHGQVKLGEVIRSYRQKKVNAVWNFRDPLPAIMYFLLSPILFIKRY